MPRPRRSLAAWMLGAAIGFWTCGVGAIDNPRADETAPAPSVPAPSGKEISKAQSNQAKRNSSRRSELPSRPEPTPAQLAALAEMEREAQLYAQGAQEYRRAQTQIVKHHYEERRRRLITYLDREIELEKERVAQTREIAMRRLEEFVTRYSGPNADPQATPEAMYRLAALYEEKGRADFDLAIEKALAPAVGLYRQIIAEFPEYKEIAGVHYYLGHALNDSGRLEEAQQAWRALVCSNHYSVSDDPKDKSKVLLQPLAQDHDDAFWNEWYARNPIPLDQRTVDQQRSKREEQIYVDPYEQCIALPQEVDPGQEPRYLAEVWWQLGNYHFDQLDAGGGPYAFNRAATCYEASMRYQKPPLYGVAMYKRAWTYYKQQRYRDAVHWYVELLRHADEQEKETGDPGADFRSEAYTYIAGSLTYGDFDGPPAQHPFIPRVDVLDEETDSVRAEERLQIAIARVQDPQLIPQDEKWTVEIYKALAKEFTEISQNRNAVTTLELTLRKFPLDRDAPVIQDRVAELYDELAKLAPDRSAVREEALAAALAARTKLADYVGDTPWTQANREDVEAIQQAELLVRKGLQRAAADHTNAARTLVAKAKQLSDQLVQRQLLDEAISEYRQAAKGWRGYIDQDPNAVDAYESRFWLADASFWNVVLQVQVGRTPGVDEVNAAMDSARRVRDSNEDDQYLQPAAYYLVVLADKLLEARYSDYVVSGGTRGFPRRAEVAFSGEGDARRPVRLDVPREVQQAVRARDEYNESISFEEDPQKNGLLYAFQAADHYFVYGQFDEAQRRFDQIYQAYCGSNEWGYKAWEKLISMSNFQGDAARSRQLVDSKSCAFDEETRLAEDAIRTPVRQGVAYLDARKLYDEAEKLAKGPARDAKWREAAAAYKVALDAAPDRDEAPEAAMNGAYAYKQVGEYDRAIEMYELFISRYGNDDKLRALREGDPDAKPPVEASPAKYEDRVKYLKGAYDALANAYVLFFDYPKAAVTFESIGKSDHFSTTERKESAQQAMNLYASLGDAKAMGQARDAFARLGATPAELAEADFVLASSSLKQWDQYSPDAGANRAARQRAEGEMQRYFSAHENEPQAQRYVVEAAHWMAKLKASAKDTGSEAKWWERAIAAFSQLKANSPKGSNGVNEALGSRAATLAAEGAYSLLDSQIRAKFDYDSGHHRFKGTPQQVLSDYQAAAKQAKSWYDQLQSIVDDYGSPQWGTSAIARQGTLYDSLRSGLYNVRPPELQMFDAKTEKLLQRAEESDNFELQDKADAVRLKVETAWRDQRDRELASADQIVVDRYGAALVLARRYNLSTPAVARATRRLAFLTDVIGEDKMAMYANRVNELNYAPGMFPRLRPGMVTAPDPSGYPGPSPDAGGRP